MVILEDLRVIPGRIHGYAWFMLRFLVATEQCSSPSTAVPNVLSFDEQTVPDFLVNDSSSLLLDMAETHFSSASGVSGDLVERACAQLRSLCLFDSSHRHAPTASEVMVADQEEEEQPNV